MTNFDELTGVNTQKRNPRWLQIPDQPYRILIKDGSGSGKVNALHNLIKHQQDINKIIFLHVTDPYKSKYQYHIKQREDT